MKSSIFGSSVAASKSVKMSLQVKNDLLYHGTFFEFQEVHKRPQLIKLQCNSSGQNVSLYCQPHQAPQAQNHSSNWSYSFKLFIYIYIVTGRMPSKVHMLRGQWQWNTPYAATLKRIRTVRQVKLPSQCRPASPSRTMLSPSHVSSIPDASGKLVTWTKKQGFRSHKSQQNHFKITSWVDPRFIFMYRMCMMCTLKRINDWSILPHFKGYLSSVTWEIIGTVQ